MSPLQTSPYPNTGDPEPARPNVVIIGAGFGGLSVARGLVGSRFDVTIVDRQNHHLFQPLLYQVATAAVSPADVAVPVRSHFRDCDNIRVLMDEALDVDLEGRTVVGRAGRYGYDVLVIATGSRYAFFGNERWRRRALSLKTLEDALVMRERILLAFERAELATEESERRALMTFVVIGAGPTGVELAGAIAELAKSTLARDFRRIRPTEARIILLEAGPSVLPGYPARLSAFARRALERKGVDVRLGTAVKEIHDEGVIAGADGVPIHSAIVLWAAGTEAAIIGHWPSEALDRAGRVKVEPDLSVRGHPEVFVIGDAAHCVGANGHPLPAVAPVAKQQGEHVARLLRAGDAARRARFRYRDQGMLATIGRGAAVADLGALRLTGWLAWMFWGLVHIFFLISFRARVMIFLNWAWMYLTYGLGARLITGRDAGRSGGR